MSENTQVVFEEMKRLLTNVLQHNNLLVDAMRLIPYGKNAPRIVQQKLMNSTYCERIIYEKENPVDYIQSALSTHIIGNNGGDTLFAMVYSGVLNLNPALIAIKCIMNDVYFVAMAKEGIIKQKTAHKAVDMLKNMMTL